MKTDSLRENLSVEVFKCKSPIEAMMMNGLLLMLGNDVHMGEPPFKIEQQVEVRGYVVDFVITTAYGTKAVVECDGHDYHERTKEQAARDKRRDRELVSAGYVVLRYTGSEIYRDPVECAADALQKLDDVEFPRTLESLASFVQGRESSEPAPPT